MIISSKDNVRVKEIKKLKQKKYRNEKYIVEGSKMIQEAINENVNIELIVLRAGTEVSFDISKFEIIEVAENVFNDLSDVTSPQGVLAVVKKDEKSNEINLNENYILVLDGIQDPGNLGTIIRTADSANLKQIIVSKDTADCYSPKVIRSTMGSIYRVKIIEVEDLEKTLLNLKKNNFEIITTELEAKKSIYEIDYDKKIVVIGNEGNGVSHEIRNISDIKAKIPMLGKAESLNASVAAGIMIYEYVRQNS